MWKEKTTSKGLRRNFFSEIDSSFNCEMKFLKKSFFRFFNFLVSLSRKQIKVYRRKLFTNSKTLEVSCDFFFTTKNFTFASWRCYKVLLKVSADVKSQKLVGRKLQTFGLEIKLAKFEISNFNPGFVENKSQHYGEI